LAANRARWVTIDTSPLCAIEHLDLFSKLTFLFDQIHIPHRVRVEFEKKRGSRRTLPRIRRELSPYKYCNVADSVSIQLLLHEHVQTTPQKPREHEGEAEAIVQASQIGAPFVIVDEKQARKWAEGRGLVCRGTLWILDQLREQELIGPLGPMFAKLDREGIRLPKAEIKRLLQKFNEDEPSIP
jgi:predicted nucleic acid-binding protein